MSDTVWVKVDCIAQHRVSYMIEAPADHPEYALDDVTMEIPKEFSQDWLGEVIFSHRVVSKEEALRICDEENDYAQAWGEDKKIEVFFTRQGEVRDL